MLGSKILITLFASIAEPSLAAPASFFSVTGVSVTDLKIPDVAHYISFTVSNPNAVFEQGGPDPGYCKFNWTMTVPCCFSQCTGNSNYYARITPDTFESAHNFKVDVVEQFAYQNSVQNNATVAFVSGRDGYSCSNGAQTDVCQSTVGVNETFVTEYGIGSLGDLCS